MYGPKEEAKRVRTSLIDVAGLRLDRCGGESSGSVGVVAVRLDRVVLRRIKARSAGSRRH